jgi:hypothetical protein
MEKQMRIDGRWTSRLGEEDRKALDAMRRARAVAGAAVVGVLVTIALTAPPGAQREMASVGTAAGSMPSEGSLLALEHGRLG